MFFCLLLCFAFTINYLLIFLNHIIYLFLFMIVNTYKYLTQSFRKVEHCHPEKVCDASLLYDPDYVYNVIFSLALQLKNEQKRTTYLESELKQKKQVIATFNLKPNRKNQKHIHRTDVQNCVQAHQKFMDFQQNNKLNDKKDFFMASAQYGMDNNTRLFVTHNEIVCVRFNKTMKQNKYDESTKIYLAVLFTCNSFTRSARTVINQTVCYFYCFV